MSDANRSADYICVRCGRPVEKYRADYDLFEKMHWLCFHLTYEHQADADVPCADPSCPNWHLQLFRQKLTDLGYDPDRIVEEAIERRYKQNS